MYYRKVRGLMKKYFVIVFMLSVVFLSACRDEAVRMPEETGNTLFVSHLKDNKLSVLSEENSQVVETELPVTVADMTRIDAEHVAYSTKNQSSLYLLNTSSGEVKKWGTVGSGINELMYDKNRGYLYLADSDHSSVQVFDTEKEEVIQDIEVGQFPLSMTMENQFLYILNQKSSSVSVIDTEELQVVREFPVPHLPEGIWVQDQKVYVGGHGPVHGELNRYVYQLDATTGEQLDRFQVGLMPVRLYSPKGSNDLYVVCHGSHELYRLSLEDPSERERVKVGANPYDMTGDQGKLYVSNVDSDTISVIDPATFRVTDEIEVSGGPFALVKGGE